MNCPSVSSTPAPVIVRGIGIELPATVHASALEKATKLLRHHRRIIRVRIDFERERARHCIDPAIASGRVEINGCDMVARAKAPTLSSSLDRLIAKLDRMLRERTKLRVNRRNDRPAGAEFRDLIAPPTKPSFRIH